MFHETMFSYLVQMILGGGSDPSAGVYSAERDINITAMYSEPRRRALSAAGGDPQIRKKCGFS